MEWRGVGLLQKLTGLHRLSYAGGRADTVQSSQLTYIDRHPLGRNFYVDIYRNNGEVRNIYKEYSAIRKERIRDWGQADNRQA